MGNWEHYTALIYYTGAGFLLLATSIRFIFNQFYSYSKNVEFIEKLKTEDLQKIYNALYAITQKMNITADLPGPKPLP